MGVVALLQPAQALKRLGWERVADPLRAEVGIEAEVQAVEVIVQLVPQRVYALAAGPKGHHREVGRAVAIGGGVGRDIGDRAAHRADLEEVHRPAADQPGGGGGEGRGVCLISPVRAVGSPCPSCSLLWALAMTLA